MISLTLATKGLKLGDNTPDRSIECPDCNDAIEFNTDSIVWDDDGKFEYSDEECENCNYRFQLCAISNGSHYEFFAS